MDVEGLAEVLLSMGATEDVRLDPIGAAIDILRAYHAEHGPWPGQPVHVRGGRVMRYRITPADGEQTEQQQHIASRHARHAPLDIEASSAEDAARLWAERMDIRCPRIAEYPYEIPCVEVVCLDDPDAAPVSYRISGRHIHQWIYTVAQDQLVDPTTGVDREEI